jgi:hypothetical protein
MKSYARGNALLEYAVPMALLLLGGAFLSSVVDIKGLIAEYFMSGSGYTKSALSGGTFKTNSMPKPAVATSGTGNEAMSSTASLTDGGGGSVPNKGVSFTATGAITRPGGRVAPSTTETLF